MSPSRRTPPEGAQHGTVWFGGPVDRLKISLRVANRGGYAPPGQTPAEEGDGLDVAEVTRLLGCEPTKIRRHTRTRSSDGQTRSFSSWSLQVEGEEDLDEILTGLLSRVSNDLTAWKLITSRYDVDLFCGLFLSMRNQGVELSVGVLSMLAERGLRIGFDIYAPDDEQT